MLDFPVLTKNSPENAGDLGVRSLLGRFHGGGHDNPLQYFTGESPMDSEPGGFSLWGHKESDDT